MTSIGTCWLALRGRAVRLVLAAARQGHRDRRALAVLLGQPAQPLLFQGHPGHLGHLVPLALHQLYPALADHPALADRPEPHQPYLVRQALAAQAVHLDQPQPCQDRQALAVRPELADHLVLRLPFPVQPGRQAHPDRADRQALRQQLLAQLVLQGRQDLVDQHQRYPGLLVLAAQADQPEQMPPPQDTTRRPLSGSHL